MELDRKYASVVLSRIFANGVTSDRITLIGGVDGQNVPIHRNVLMACSKYFTAILGPNSNENAKTEFVLDEADGAVLKSIVEFCYTGRIDLTKDNMIKLLAISASVGLDFLNAKCRRFVSNKITLNIRMPRSKALEVFFIADKYDYEFLRKHSLNIISESFEKLPASELREFDWRLLEAIMKNNIGLHVPQDFVFNRLVEWFRHDETEREQHMAELLKLIRLEFIPSEFLMDEQLEAIFKRFNRFESIVAERRTRESAPMEESNDDQNQSRSIFSLCKQEHDKTISIERYNSESNTFEDVGTINIGDRESYEVQLHENKLYVMGGSYGKEYFKSVSRFDLITGEEEILPNMNGARDGFTSILVGKYIYVFGGCIARDKDDADDTDDTDESSDSDDLSSCFDYRSLNSCERFDISTKTWTALEPMNDTKEKARAIALNGYIHAVGDWIYPELYDPKYDEWHQLAECDGISRSPTLFTSNSFLYARGHRNSLRRYDLLTNSWTKLEHNIPDLRSSVQNADGIFAITSEGNFGKLSLDVNDMWSFEMLSKSRGNLLFLNRTRTSIYDERVLHQTHTKTNAAL